MKSKLSKILFGFLLLSALIAAAQEKEISGYVTDANSLSLPGVTVAIKNTTLGTQTDFDGKFSIKAAPDDILVFTFLGYKTQEIKAGSQSNLTVQLLDESVGLDEIVIVAYGTQKQRAVVGAIGKVSSEVLEKRKLLP